MHHVHTGADKAADRSEADGQRDHACYAGGQVEPVMHKDSAEHGDQCFGGKGSNAA